MELRNEEERRKFNRAKRRLEQLKGFYWHLGVYLIVNLFITISKVNQAMIGGASFEESFFDFGTFAIWFFWGIGLAFHAARVFAFNPFFGKDWEERQIRKMMDKDKREAEKYR